ncbi:MAG TPA: protein kinase, partial [Sandaracinaceae bacterium LLY-WYZ-13_1]|nr:protein kinase [Sandaracinaceae bacterium LLY-WYZ-13_1]
MTDSARVVSKLQPDDVIDGYLVKRKLGEGGMAEVYVVARLGPGASTRYAKHFALKLIRAEHADSPEFALHFEREMGIANQLDHPNIVSIANYGEYRGRRYLVMELVQGVDLGALTRELATQARDPDDPRPTVEGQERRALPPRLVACIGFQMAEALAYAHADERHGEQLIRKGVVHRDISPGNVMVDKHGYIKINDWGIARSVKTGQRAISGTQHAIGKLAYMPPEQLNGQPLDGRADLYATGITLARLLLGRHPYAGPDPEADSELAVAARAAQGQRKPFRELAPNAPAPLVDTLERLVQPDRDQRMGSADELIAALSPLVENPRRLRIELGSLCCRVYEGQPDTQYDSDSQPGSDVRRADAGAQSAKRRIVTREEQGPATPPSHRTAPLPDVSPTPRTVELAAGQLPSESGQPAVRPTPSTPHRTAESTSQRTTLFVLLGAAVLVLTALLVGAGAFVLGGLNDDEPAPEAAQT